MRVTVIYDSTHELAGTRHDGRPIWRPTAMLAHGHSGESIGDHEYNVITSFWVRLFSDDLHEAAEKAWRQMNVVDGTELPIQLQVRSMCIGDVVVLHRDDRPQLALIARSFGFEEIDFPEVQ